MRQANPLIDDLNRHLVQMLADGASRAEIGAELHLSQGAINHRLFKLRQRVGATTTARLVAVALRRKWIH